MRFKIKSTRNETSTHRKRNSVYITFHYGRNEMKFHFGDGPKKNGPYLFSWSKRMCICFLSHDFISGSVYKIFYHPKWNFISVKMATMNPAGIYLLKGNNKNTRTKCEICSKLTIKTPERPYWRRAVVFIVNFEHISNIALVFLLLTLSR